MKASKEYLKTHQILPSISFKDGKPHTVQLLQDKARTITDKNGEEKEGIVYKVMEGSEIKRFFTCSQGLISQLAGLPEKSIVTIQLKRKSQNGQVRCYFETKTKEVSADEVGDDNIPVVDEEDYDQEPEF